MVCGVNLGILLICLVQVEYVRCLWETQGESFKKQNGNVYDPFAQNRLRQASFPSGFDQSLNRGLSGSGYSEAAPKLTQSDRYKVQYVKSRPNLQGPTGDLTQKWPLRGSELASASSVSKYRSPQKTDFNAVRNSPVQGSQGHRRHMSSSNPIQSSRESYTFRKPHMTAAKTPVHLKNTVQTSVTVRGKPVHGPKKHAYNQRERFPYNPAQVTGGYRPYNPQSYSWSRPQSSFNRKTPDGQDPSTVTYRVADEYGGSFIIRLKSKDRSEEVRPLKTGTSPPQTAFHHNQGQKVPKSVWRKVKSKGMPLD